ncbi:hypothetical protein [Methylobacterium sp. J-067]|uniref:hypothetical protein n=1 Tax=Methylobacterium sp. J-067 TaxID=2836648 RepID=UPI001FB9FB63|nr:hypothetical protein [Methylobacterium sp. J-067]MCJ2023580.1 hypothetical protein [Methylobacterium sp. J-067]
MERVIGFGIRESQARQVFESVRGLKNCAAKLSVGREMASRWARELGVEILPHVNGPIRPELRKVSDAEVLAAILGPRSLTQEAHLIGLTAAGLLKRPRASGLPTAPPSRAAFRASRMRRAAA